MESSIELAKATLALMELAGVLTQEQIDTFNDLIGNAQDGLDFANTRVEGADDLWEQFHNDAPYTNDGEFEQGSQTLEAIISKYKGAKSAATWALNLIHQVLWDLMGASAGGV